MNVNDPDPPTGNMSFSEWIQASPGATSGAHPQALRVLHWLNMRLPKCRQIQDREDLVAFVYLTCIERFHHKSTEWQAPLATFARLTARTFFGEQSRTGRNKQFAEDEDEASAEANVVDHRSNPDVAIDQRERALQAVQQQLDDFDSKWLRHEIAVIRQMPEPWRTRMALLLHEWTWAEMADHYGAEHNNADTNWRHRGERAFCETWKRLYMADSANNYDLYHAERETKRLAIRKLKEFGREEGLTR